MTTRGIIAIDPGISGAIALLVDGDYNDVQPMPITQKKSGRNQVSSHDLYDLVCRMQRNADDVDCIIEQVAAMPGQGVSSMFSLGDSFGVARTIAALYARRLAFVMPGVWKRKAGLTKDKKYSLTLARDTFPEARDKLKRRKDEGLAEALLLAHYGHLHHPW